MVKKAIICLAVYSLGVVSGFADESVLIREQFVGFFAQQPVSDSLVGEYLNELGADGTWPDIDYASKRPGDWPTRQHLSRLQEMAVGYVHPESKFYQDEDLAHAVLNGLEHWIENDYRNPNWFNARIGVPQRMATSMILLGDALPKKTRNAAEPILLRSKMGMTGQNKIWIAGNNFMISLLYDDPDLMEKAVTQIWSELRVSTEEGIQADWSFHQHGPQQQFGNYGMSFASDMIKWASILRGTDYALAGDKLEILSNYMLNGVSWVIWADRLDFSCCGRQIDENEPVVKGRNTLRQLETMQTIDPERSAEYRNVLNRVGFKAFWRSEMVVQRRPDWYASVKMNSSRVIGSESCNMENMQGLHQGDGVLMIYQRGDEAENIMPLWDWNRLPGTTCDQEYGGLGPPGYNSYRSPSDFAGVIGHDDSGMAAMIYKRNALAARKAWFISKNSIVCLGSGIEGETKGPVYTSVQQVWRKGEVKEGDGWIHHDGIGYRIIEGTSQVKTETVKSNWQSCFPDRADRPVTGEVFSVWIDHGQSPKGASYAYIIYPGKTAAVMEQTIAQEQTKILSNTPKLQAIESEWGVNAVFYEAGELVSPKGITITVDAPCLLSLRGDALTISDPLHNRSEITVSLNGKAQTIQLPSGDETGKQVVHHLTTLAE